MANEQEQQSVVTEQQPAVTQQQQPVNLYQALGSLNPQQLLQLKSNVQKRAGRREIYRNVGGDRGAQLISSVEKGEITTSEAIARSKSELTPNMQSIDSAYFTKGATAASMLPLKERMKNTWTKTERNLWLSHYNSLDRRETSVENARIKANKNISKKNKARFQHYVDNKNHLGAGRSDYIIVETEAERIANSFGDVGVPPEFNTAYNAFIDEVNKDLDPDLKNMRGDQREMNKQIVAMANQIPYTFLDAQEGFHIEGEFIPTFEKGYSTSALREMWAKQLIKRVLQAKNHINALDEYYEPQQPTEEAPAEGGGDDWSKYMVE